MLDLSEIQGSVWQYGRRDSPHEAHMVRLLEDGRISGFNHPNESSWRFSNGLISFHHADGRTTVTFENIQEQDGQLIMSGQYALNPELNIVLVLTQSLAAQRPMLQADQGADTSATARSARLLVNIAFHYRASTIQYLLSVLMGYLSFDIQRVDVYIHTNAAGPALDTLRASVDFYAQNASGGLAFSVTIKPVHDLSDPWHLPWSHKREITETFLNHTLGYTHFIYSEDDLRLDFANFRYFLKYLPPLKKLGLLPSFCVTECSNEGTVYAKEQFGKTDLRLAKGVNSDDLLFANHANPYNAFFILDRELAEEYVRSDSFDMYRSVHKSAWWIAERAAMGLCFENIPVGFEARYVVPVMRATGKIPPFALVAHLPNKYANDRKSLIAKLPLADMFEK